MRIVDKLFRRLRIGLGRSVLVLVGPYRYLDRWHPDMPLAGDQDRKCVTTERRLDVGERVKLPRQFERCCCSLLVLLEAHGFLCIDRTLRLYCRWIGEVVSSVGWFLCALFVLFHGLVRGVPTSLCR